MHKVPLLPEKYQILFWQKVDKSGECWNWTGAKFTSGYGMVRYDRKNFGSHRLSYVMANGEIPHGMIVCHRCDNPSCVNPAHLFAGTFKDNVQDMIRKGRKSPTHGALNGQASLTDEKVVEIREWYAAGDVTHHEIARQFGVSPADIGLITQGAIWKHVGGPITDGMSIRDKRPSKTRGEKNHNAKLTEKSVAELRKIYSQGGVTMKKVGAMFGICAQTACSIIHRKKWKHVGSAA